MAAPTNVRVEAQSQTTTVLRWDYSGSAAIKVYRSEDGSDYTALDDYIINVEEHTDTGLVGGTKYWYKLSDDSGSTFSDVVTVYTHFCAGQSGIGRALGLPRLEESEETAAKFNDLAERVERFLGGRLDPNMCYICPEDGAVVVDCTDDCSDFLIVAEQDINSFTLLHCDKEPPFNIFVPPDTTSRICGFPVGHSFSGDECFEAPISGGSSGRTISGSGKSKKGPPSSGGGGGFGGGGGGAGCECVPGRNNELKLKCCSDGCSLNCNSTNKRLLIKVCGGVPPYTFEHTGAVKFEKGPGQGTVDEIVADKHWGNPQVVVVPPPNTGSGVAGTAYVTGLSWEGRNGAGCPNCSINGFNCGSGAARAAFGCNDQFLNFPTSLSCGTTQAEIYCQVILAAECGSGTPCSGSRDCSELVDACTAMQSGKGAVTDCRTAGMISNGCSPCRLNKGASVSVTDAAGVTYTVVLSS